MTDGDGPDSFGLVPASVVIAAHADERWSSLVRAVQSVRTQRPQPAEVIVAVDHNEALFARVRDALPYVTAVENDDMPGASGARNAGVARASTQYVAFLDDDAHAQTGWLATLLEPFEDPDVVGSGGRVDPEWATSAPGWFPSEFAWVVGASYTGLPVERARVRNVWSGNMAVRRDVFEAVGGFVVGFGKLGHASRPEDTDLCIRMSASAPRRHWVYLPDARVYHMVPASRSTFGFFLRRSFSEGGGKVEMSQRLPSDDNLGSERDYLRQTVPRGIVRSLKASIAQREPALAVHGAAMVAGTAAAAAGAAVALARGLRRPPRPRSAAR